MASHSIALDLPLTPSQQPFWCRGLEAWLRKPALHTEENPQVVSCLLVVGVQREHIAQGTLRGGVIGSFLQDDMGDNVLDFSTLREENYCNRFRPGVSSPSYLDQAELAKLVGELRAKPERMIFRQFPQQDADWQSHPTMRERLLFLYKTYVATPRDPERTCGDGTLF
jgi:hypothetical protein